MQWGTDRQWPRLHSQGMPQRDTSKPFQRTTHWFGLWGVVLLSACTAPFGRVDVPLGVDVPATWSGGEAGRYRLVSDVPTNLAQWWLRFNDPLLTQLVNQALAANTRVAGAQAALRQAQALRDVAAAALAPTVGVSASAQRSEAGSGGSATGANTLATGLNAAWLPDLSGGLRLGLAATDATALASAATLGDVQGAVVAEVALTYITLRSGQMRLSIAQANLANQLETLQITRWRQQAGLLTVLDTEQARAASEQTRALLPPLQTSVRQAGHALAVLTGLAPGEALTRYANAELETHYSQAVEPYFILNVMPQASADAVLALPAQTLLQRPSVVAARHQWDAARARLTRPTWQACPAPN